MSILYRMSEKGVSYSSFSEKGTFKAAKCPIFQW
jgi:hypothetical protein